MPNQSVLLLEEKVPEGRMRWILGVKSEK